MNLESICLQVCELARTTGAFILDERERLTAADIAEKGEHDLVTAVDKASEVRLAQGLEVILPEAGFEAEEGTSEKSGRNLRWIVDPIDGTTNFIHGIPCFAVSIALVEDNEPIIGVIYEVNQQECFYTWKGAPAYLNGEEIRVTEASNLHNCMIATGFPYTNYYRLAPYMSLFEHLVKNSRSIRRLGSAATDLAYVAAGRFEAFYEYGLKPWDVAAGIILVKQAGGVVTDFSRGDNCLYGGEIVASNSACYGPFMEVFDTHFSASTESPE